MAPKWNPKSTKNRPRGVRDIDPTKVSESESGQESILDAPRSIRHPRGQILNPFWIHFGTDFGTQGPIFGVLACTRAQFSLLVVFFMLTCFFLNFTKLRSGLHKSSILASPGGFPRATFRNFWCSRLHESTIFTFGDFCSCSLVFFYMSRN